MTLPTHIHRRWTLSVLVCCTLALGAVAWCQDAGDGLPNRAISGCETPSDFTSARTPDRPDFHFDAWELEATAGAKIKGNSLRWHVKPADARQTSARLGYSRQIPGPLDAISLWVKNPNGHQIGLHLEAIDADGIAYVSPTLGLGEELGWRELVFPTTDMSPSRQGSDAWPGLDFPIVWLQVVIDSLETGKPYTIYVDEISGKPRELVRANAGTLTAPPSLGPGERIPAAASITFERAPAADTRLFAELQRDGATLARAPLDLPAGVTPGQAAQVQAEALAVPRWLPPGRYDLALTSPDLDLIGPGAQPLTIAVAGPLAGEPSATVSTDGPRPLLRLGERAVAPVIGQAARELPDDCDVIAVPATTDSHPFGWTRDASPSEGVTDFRGLDRMVAGTLGARPESLVLLEVFVDSPTWWDEANADQLVTFGGEPTGPLSMWGRRRTFPDLISGRWAGAARDRLKALVEHVEASPYAHRVIGYELQAGDLGAWRPWGAELDAGDETGALRQAAYRNFLVERYRNFGVLRAAWGLPPMLAGGAPAGATTGPTSWEQLQIPTRRAGIVYPVLYDPASNGNWIDMNNFRAEAPARIIERMAAVVKEATGRRKLVGACYGHMLAQSEGSWRWPHLAVTRLLESEDLDLLTGPLWTRASAMPSEFPARSALAAGKLYLARGPASAGMGVIGDRDVAAHSIPALQTAGRDEVAVIVDDVSARYLAREGGLAGPLLAGQVREMAGTRVPWRMHTLADLIADRVPASRVYLFLDAFKIDRQERMTLVNSLCRDRNTLIWIYAPAAIDTHMLTGRTMKNLTGIALSLMTTPGAIRVKIGANSPTLDDHASVGLTYGSGAGFPLFFSADEKADRLGTLAGTEFNGLATREYNNCIMMYSAAPGVPGEVLRGLLRRAGLGEL